MTPASRAKVREALENLLIAIGMGWDLDGVVAEGRVALALLDAEIAQEALDVLDAD